MDIVIQTFQHTFTLQWAAFALPIALVLSLFAYRLPAAFVLAFFGVAIIHLGPILWPMFMASAAKETMVSTATDIIQKVNPLAAFLELIAFTFFIAVFSLTRRDMFRPAPTD